MKPSKDNPIYEMNQASIGVLVIDDHTVIRVGLRLLLDDTPGIHLVDEAANKSEAMAALEKRQPSIILLDLLLSHECGLDFLPDLLQAAPQARIIILTGCRDVQVHRQALTLGARGLVMKDQPVDVLLKAIRRVYMGELWIERELMHTVIGEMRVQQSASDPETAKIATLTARELEIVALLGEGLRNKQIAQRMFISETTVRHHLTSVFSKLEVCDRLELVIYAYRHKLVCIQREEK